MKNIAIQNQKMNKKINVKYFDEDILTFSGEYKVMSVFDNTLNLIKNDTLLAFTTKDGIAGSVLFDKEDFVNYISKEELFTFDNNKIFTKNLVIDLDKNKARYYKVDFSKIDLVFLNDNIEDYLKKKDSLGILQIFKKDKTLINDYIHKKILYIDERFNLLKDFVKEFLTLYSAGIGSTPSVDDAILGMMIIAKTFGDDTDVFYIDYNKTTLISKTMLFNCLLKNSLSDNIKNLYENKNKELIDKFVSDIGSTSGVDMLVGSYIYFNKREGKRCLKNL